MMIFLFDGVYDKVENGKNAVHWGSSFSHNVSKTFSFMFTKIWDLNGEKVIYTVFERQK